MSEIEEIIPNPYINGWLSDNSDVSYMAKVYPAYTDIVTFLRGATPINAYALNLAKTTSALLRNSQHRRAWGS